MPREISPVKAVSSIFIINAKNTKDNIENYNNCDDANKDQY